MFNLKSIIIYYFKVKTFLYILNIYIKLKVFIQELVRFYADYRIK